MEIKCLSSEFLENMFIDGQNDGGFYYFLIDSSNFYGEKNFLKDFSFSGGKYINLYDDFSENLKENGALLFCFNKQECLNNIDQINSVKNEGALNFFHSDFEIEEIQSHLEDLMEIKQPNGQSALFRFQDNFAFHATITAVHVLKLKQILSQKINYWIWQNADNKFYCLNNIHNNTVKLEILRFFKEEFEKINISLKPLRLMPLLKQYDINLTYLKFYELYDVALNLIGKSKENKMYTPEDEILFSILYHQFGEFMFEEGPLKKALDKTQITGISFQKTTDEIDLVELDLWYKKIERSQAEII
ncbi:DUF4123 domain-containing protein [Acinetobacter sp. 194]|uniref:DUF4123 domain-containing protein n=1 Tax=Acinetobacter shaoyimingii TaxID=2715164 RepID=UPI001408B25A|nr:DUF4123 domain-containing protein [Acinetobacter shaoyimingii]NHB59316.1 DUF4123 domain-containing protein [Acinetobacter shaoyimingii]